MSIDVQIEEALHSSDRPGELRHLAQRWIAEGRDREKIVAQFEQARQELRRADREDDEDAVMDVMDFLEGWCSPHVKLGESKS